MSIPKVTKQDVLNASSEMLNKDLYVVFTKPENGMKEVMENLEEHLNFQVSLEKNGVMFGAGPFWEDNEIDWNGEGMVIIRANSLDHARARSEGSGRREQRWWRYSRLYSRFYARSDDWAQ